MDECKPLPAGAPAPPLTMNMAADFLSCRSASRRLTALPAVSQGLTLDHCSAQLEPCLTHNNTLHTLHTPKHPIRAPPIP